MAGEGKEGQESKGEQREQRGANGYSQPLFTDSQIDSQIHMMDSRIQTEFGINTDSQNEMDHHL